MRLLLPVVDHLGQQRHAGTKAGRAVLAGGATVTPA